MDLTIATKAFILEPQWNPMAEEQALSWIHRMGQEKPVTTVRYIMRDSIEEVGVVLPQHYCIPDRQVAEYPRAPAAKVEARRAYYLW